MIHEQKRATIARSGVLCLSAAIVVMSCAPGGTSRDRGGPQESTGRSEEQLTSASVTVSFPNSVSASSLAIDASNSIGIGAIARVTGTVAAMGSEAGGIVVGSDATLQNDVWSADAAIVAPQATIGGTLHSPVTVIDPSATVASVDSNPVFNPEQTITWTVPTAGPSAGDVTVATGQTQALAPGAYGTVRAAQGATLTLASGVYFVSSLRLAEGSLLSYSGPTVVYVTNSLVDKGTTQDTLGNAGLLLAYLGGGVVDLDSSFTGTLVAPSALLSLSTNAYVGSFFAADVLVSPEATITQRAFPLPPSMCIGAPNGMTCGTGQQCQNGACVTPAPPASVTPPKLPPPPPPIVGCYAYSANGWQTIPCASDSFVDSTFGHPDVQLSEFSSATGNLVFGQVGVTIPQVASESDAYLSSTCAINPLCQCTGSSVPNAFSIQNNTNQFTVPNGTTVNGTDVSGHSAQIQWTIQTDGNTSSVCVWQVDVNNSASAGGYQKKCAPENPPQRAGGLQAFDQGNIAGFVNSNGTLTVEGSFTWSQPGQPNTFATVDTDYYKLASGWTAVSGGIIGTASCAQAQFTSAEVVTQVLASTCSGDTDATSAVCAPPTLQPNVSASVSAIGTVETNNLTAIGSPSVTYLNADLAASSIVGTTSGSCLGPSHAYVKDNASDFGSTPSNLATSVFWESPDLFLVPAGTPVTSDAISTETTLTPGASFDVYVRLHNDVGCSDVTGAKALVYLADPSALSVEWDSITAGNYVVGPSQSSTGVTIPAGGVNLIGPITFTAPSSGLGNGHRCILAAIEADGESAPSNTSDAPDSNQVAQRNVQFIGPCQYPLSNSTSTDGTVQITLTVTPNTGTVPSLTAGTTPDIEVAFDDADSSWFNVWSAQSGNGTTFAVTHDSTANTTTVRLGAFSVNLGAVPLKSGTTRTATGTFNLAQGTTANLQIGATLVDSSQTVLVTNGGSCSFSAPVIQ